MSLLEKNIIEKGQMNENMMELIKLDAGNNNNNKYKVEVICNSAVYTKKSASHLFGLYY